jgi:hypothetical protein
LIFFLFEDHGKDPNIMTGTPFFLPKCYGLYEKCRNVTGGKKPSWEIKTGGLI